MIGPSKRSPGGTSLVLAMTTVRVDDLQSPANKGWLLVRAESKNVKHIHWSEERETKTPISHSMMLPSRPNNCCDDCEGFGWESSPLLSH
jgi:hypothetical protein